MKIAFFGIKDWEKEIISEKLEGHEIVFFAEELDADNVDKVSDVDVLSIFIYSDVSREMIDRMPNLKLISARSTGFDHIDTAYCKEKGIEVTNVPFYGENTIAEHTFALLLSISRKIYKSYERGLKEDYSLDGLEGFDIKGKTIGVIGAGHIGQNVIKIARGFGMKVLAFDINHNAFLSELLGFEYKTIEEILEQADIITLHAPLNDHTKHMLNKDNMKLIKPGAVLLNTARGGLIETDALLEALDDGRISAAGLDVIEGEEFLANEEKLFKSSNADSMREYMRDHAIVKRPNVIFTPHNAFNSIEAKKRILNTSLDNIICYNQDHVNNSVIKKD